MIESKSRSILATCVLVVVPFLANAGEDKRAFEIADYYRTAFVGSPAVSADGSTAAFPVTRYDLPAGKSWSEIWMMGADGSGLRQMTRGRHHDSSPVFAPDGTSMLFVSDRGEGSQLYLMPVDGGEPRQLTDFPVGLSGPVWSPDGKWIAVQADVYPECGADTACNQRIADAVAAGPLKARMTDELLYRHWTSWREDRFTHVLLVDAASGEVVRDLTPGRWDSPTFSVGGAGAYVFSPDGAELCVVSNHDKDQASSTNSDLWLIPIGGGEGTNITASNRGWDGNPVYSPDGSSIAFRSQATPGYESDLFRIGLYDRRSKSVSYLTDATNFDNWINDLQWSKDGAQLFFTADVRGENPVFRTGLEGGTPSEVVADGAIAGWGLAGGDRTLIYTRSKVGQPPEIFAAPVAGGEPAPWDPVEFLRNQVFTKDETDETARTGEVR